MPGDEEETSMGFISVAVIEGLIQKPHLNGRLGHICSTTRDGRVVFQLSHPWMDPDKPEVVQDHLLSLKRSNLTLVDEPLAGKFGMCHGCGCCFGHKYLRSCARCKRAHYCSASCQTSDWKGKHKGQCRTRRASRKDKSEDLVSIEDPEQRFHARMVRALVAFEKQDSVAMEKEYRRIEEEHDLQHDAFIYSMYGCCFVVQGRIDDAIDMFQAAVRCPNNKREQPIAAVYGQLGLLLLNHKHDVSGALEAWKSGLRINPEDTECKRGLQQIRHLQARQGPSFS